MIGRGFPLLALTLAAACATAAAGDTASNGPFLYLTNQGAAAISVVDVGSMTEVERIDLTALGFGANSRPHDPAVEPDGSFWYVSLIGENLVLKFDRENRLVGRVAMEVPGLAVVHPTADLLVVGRSMSAVNPPSSIGLIRRSDMTLVDEVDVVFPRPHALAVHRPSGTIYTASLAENRMAAIDVDGTAALVDVPAPAAAAGDTAGHAGHGAGGAHDPHTIVEFAISPDGRTMVAGAEVSGNLLVFDLADPAAPRLVRAVPLGGNPWHPAFTPDGRRLYVPLNKADAVAVLDATTWEVVGRIEGRGIAEPHGAAVSPDGRTVFVSNHNLAGRYVPEGGGDAKPGTLVAIDVATGAIVKVLEVGAYATGLETVPAR